MLPDTVQISVAADQMLQFIRKSSVNPFSKKIMCICCGHFVFLLFCFHPICLPYADIHSLPGCTILGQDHTSIFSCISSSASALKSSSCTGSISGSSSSPCTPKHLRNSSVVPRRIGRPGASSRPSSLIRS